VVGGNLLLRNFGPYGIIFMNVCVIITVSMVMLLSDVRAQRDNIYDCVLINSDVHVIIDGQFSSSYFLSNFLQSLLS
jgi:hypothetical protein